MGNMPGVEVRDDKASITLSFEDGSFGTINYLANGSSKFPKERIEVFVDGRVIQLDNFIIDKNERKIKKNNLELQLSEKEINFLILFSKTKNPVSKKFLLKNVWNYSLETETHTVETHIHRLRKKILEKFGEKNFIKNNNKGYYI